MASVTTKQRVSPKGAVSYQVQVRGKGVEKPYSKTFSCPVEAQEWATEQEIYLASDATLILKDEQGIALTESPEYTVEALTHEYMMSTQYKGGVKKNGYETILNRLQTVARIFGNKDISTITELDVNQYSITRQSEKAKNRLTNIKGSTVRKELELLKRLLNWSRDKKGIKIAVDIKGDLLPEEGEARSKVISVDEYKRMTEWSKVRCAWLTPLLILGWETAMRRGEILALVPEWIDFDNRFIKLPKEVCKNGESREVPLSTTAMELLKRLMGTGETAMKPNQLFFTIGETSVPQAFKRMCQDLDIKDAVFHSLRHTSITNYSKKPGMTLAFLARISGHKDLQVLMCTYMKTETSFIAGLMD